VPLDEQIERATNVCYLNVRSKRTTKKTQEEDV
jgi:hypothetical protein